VIGTLSLVVVTVWTWSERSLGSFGRSDLVAVLYLIFGGECRERYVISERTVLLIVGKGLYNPQVYFPWCVPSRWTLCYFGILVVRKIIVQG
jgi:hypothetical protein